MKDRRTMLIAGGAVLLLIAVIGYAVGGFGSSEPPSVPTPVAGNDYGTDDVADGTATVERDAPKGDSTSRRGARVAATGPGDEDEDPDGDEQLTDKKKKRKKKRSRKSSEEEEEEEEQAKKSGSAKPKLKRSFP